MSRTILYLLLILPYYLANATTSTGVDQNFSFIPGPFETVDTIAQNSKGQMDKLAILTSKTKKNFEDYKDAKTVKINQHFMLSLLMNTPEEYLYLSSQNHCLFYHLLFLGLYKVKGNFPKNTLLVDILFKNGNKLTALTMVDDFLKYQFQFSCFENKDTIKTFLFKSRSQTFSKLILTPPQTEKACQKEVTLFLQRNDAIHLCYYTKLLKKKNDHIPTFSPIHQTYIDSMCQNILSPHQFCQTYLKNNYWDKVLTKEKPEYPLKFLCKGILRKKEITSEDYLNCLSKIKQNDDLCHFNNSFIYPALTPRPSCEKISKALLHAKYIPLQDDCPGKVLNEGITNITRLKNYLGNTKQTRDKADCHISPLKSFIKLTQNKTYHPIWNFKICYPDPIQGKESCYPFYYGEYLKDPLSEVTVINKIIAKLKGNNATKCKVVEKDEYNPNFLSYKRGCFILYSKRNCSALTCPKKIIYNQKTIKDIKYTEGTLFNYLPSDRLSRQYALINILSDNLKISTSLPIKTNTGLKKINKEIKSIIHGVGCSEDIYPSFFPQRSLNGCTPLPFIIDGYLYENKKDLVIIRTAIDDIYSPRLIPWHQIYTAVYHYSSNLPFSDWTLYEIKL